MSGTKRFQLGAVLLCLAPLMARAGDATTQPTVTVTDEVLPNTDSPDAVSPAAGAQTPADPKNHRGDRAALRAAKMFPAPTDKEISEAMDFMHTHSPRRYQAIQSMPDSDKKIAVRNFTVRAYENWMRLAVEEPEVYPVVLKRIGTEDEIYGIASDLKKAPADKQDELTDLLKTDVGKLVDIGLEERRARLNHLRSILDKEQASLDADKTQTEDPTKRAALVESRVQAILKTDDSRGLVPDAGPNMGTGEKTEKGPGGPRGHNGSRQP
jgi:hypothetical protein